MPRRPVTLFTGQWADLPLEELAPLAREMGYDGLELACWGDHFDVRRALEDEGYAAGRRELLSSHDLRCWAIGNHLVGQAVCDPIDERHRATLPERVWGDGDPEGVRRRAAEEMKDTARAARRLGVEVVTGFTGSSVWHKLYFFPPTPHEEVEAGYEDFARRWNPILDVFDEEGVRFAFEVHPTEIAYDLYSAERALEAVGGRRAFGFNFDPSHLYWQFVDPVKFIDRFADRIYHVHMKDAARTLDGQSGILSSHLPFGDHRRGWDFRSLGRGGVDFEEIVRALNRTGYGGPLSVEWEDSGMDRVHGARESAAFVRRLDFEPSGVAFDAAFGEE
ncbi:Xylose isomerase-like TIM barrel [Rubrobacter xylanophilus DSM 9941]|uniref:Xylose isomerase-like TIM barrel n=1 Tax=Rubrobacter xylanophilus (strain DSM 9941 / JCM 11954 / NBRC 16129 / PRD-1) TaxID=266117 RepID=Q1AZ10_RUBXD|nr:sugar phosphate isomerase/epimerase [Rubrobacter xylanophilus]ABG03368.1 Xylose isomerase-like TIM barrel [Rubrobacter xylanophilus DSM 9941]